MIRHKQKREGNRAGPSHLGTNTDSTAKHFYNLGQYFLNTHVRGVRPPEMAQTPMEKYYNNTHKNRIYTGNVC